MLDEIRDLVGMNVACHSCRWAQMIEVRHHNTAVIYICFTTDDHTAEPELVSEDAGRLGSVQLQLYSNMI